jgi:hypothetical protein
MSIDLSFSLFLVLSRNFTKRFAIKERYLFTNDSKKKFPEGSIGKQDKRHVTCSEMTIGQLHTIELAPVASAPSNENPNPEGMPSSVALEPSRCGLGKALYCTILGLGALISVIAIPFVLGLAVSIGLQSEFVEWQDFVMGLNQTWVWFFVLWGIGMFAAFAVTLALLIVIVLARGVWTIYAYCREQAVPAAAAAAVPAPSRV